MIWKNSKRTSFSNFAMKGLPSLIFLMVLLPNVISYCPREKMHSFGDCSFRVQCSGTIRGVSLPEECQGNQPVTIDVTLTSAVDTFNDQIDVEFVTAITTLRASGNWPVTNLTFLEDMPLVQHLHLSRNQIFRIDGNPFMNLIRLETLDLSYNDLSNIDNLFHFEIAPNKLKKLSLAYNSLETLPALAFEELTNLVELDLSHNYIQDLNEEPFANLTDLELLKLNNNKIKNLNGAVNTLVNLKHLFLSGNKLQNIDDASLKIIYHLETFDVSGNELEKLKPIIFTRHWQHFGGHSVCKIILSQNQITNIPNATSVELLARFTRTSQLRRTNVDIITELDLSKNVISSIEYNAFQYIIQLISLDLSSNKLESFIVNSDDLTHVRLLNLSSNYLTNLHLTSFSTMNNLQNLDLSDNLLSSIPDQTFTYNYNLKYVNMTNNEIAILKHLHIKMFHSDGGVLDLSNNGLSRLHIPNGEGLRLTYLVLHSNNISDPSLINLEYQNELKSLELNKNQIKELDKSSFRLPVGLVFLDLRDNKIDEIKPSSFSRLTHLRTLRLSHNRLSSIEYGTFQGLTGLLNLDLSFNNIKYLDSKPLIDLKSLSVLSLRYNGMIGLEHKSWLGHKSDLIVYVEGNILSCEWLAVVLSDFNNGYSKVRPVVLSHTITGASLEGVPCVAHPTGANTDMKSPEEIEVMADERLLVTNQKILEAVREQTGYLQSMVHLLSIQKVYPNTKKPNVIEEFTDFKKLSHRSP